MIVPFIVHHDQEADHVRNVLFSAVIGHKEAKKLAHASIARSNTMSHGLVMLGPDGRVVVANAEAAQALCRSNRPTRCSADR